jgi:tetratricopeptide (TPR) repeat protein
VWDASGRVERVLTGHTARWAEPLGLAPDGRSLVSVGAREDIKKDGKALGYLGRRELRVWDLTTGAARVEGEVSGVWSQYDESPVRFTPDGRYAVGIDPLHPVTDLTTGKEAVTAPRGSIATGFTSGGREVVLVTHPGIVTRVRLDTGAPAATYRLPSGELDGEYSYPTLNRDGTALACLSPNMSVCVTDPRTGLELRTVPTGVRQFSGDSHRLVLGPQATRVVVHNLNDHEVKVWDVSARSAARTLAPLHGGINWAVAVSPDATAATCISQSRLGAVGEDFKPIDQVDLVAGRRVERDEPLPFRSVTDLCYSPDGKRVGGLFYAFFNSPVNPLQRVTRYTAVVSDTATGAHTVGNSYVVAAEESWSNRATREPAPRMTCAADGTFLIAHSKAAGKGGGAAQTWQVEEFGTGRVRFTFPATAGRAVVLAPGGRLAALFGLKSGVPAIEVWDLDAGVKLPWPGDADAVRTGVESGVFSGDGRRLLTLSEATSDGNEGHFNRGPRQPRATVWDVRSGTAVCTFAPPMGVTAQWAIFSPDGERLLFYTGLARNNIVTLWNATTGRELIAKLESEVHSHGGAFTPDGRLILEVQDDLNRGFGGPRVQVWNGTASGPVWRPAPTADGWLDEADRLLAAGRPADAVPLCQRAVDAYPTREATLSALGLALIRSGRANEAIAVLRRCAGSGEPDWTGGRRLRSAEHFLLALACHHAGRPEEARTWFDTGEGLLRTFHSFQNPRGGSVSYPTTPSAERTRSEPFRAEAAAALGVALRPLPPLDAGERMDWATDAVKKGDHALGTRTADEIVAATRFVAILYNAACVHSLAAAATADEALRGRYADRAMALLNDALDAKLGDYFRGFGVNVLDHMTKDADLDPIRHRADFKELLAGLERKSPPAAVAPPPREAK